LGVGKQETPCIGREGLPDKNKKLMNEVRGVGCVLVAAQVLWKGADGESPEQTTTPSRKLGK
jgi:hypothetical protein